MNIDNFELDLPAAKTVTEYVLWLEAKVKEQAQELRELRGSMVDMERTKGE